MWAWEKGWKGRVQCGHGNKEAGLQLLLLLLQGFYVLSIQSPRAQQKLKLCLKYNLDNTKKVALRNERNSLRAGLTAFPQTKQFSICF